MLKRNRRTRLQRVGSTAKSKPAKLAYGLMAAIASAIGLAAVIKRRRNADNSDARTSAS